MPRRGSIWLPMCMAGVASAFAQDVPLPLAAFDEEVAGCRRVIGQCCAIVQDMAKEKELDAAAQTKGLTLLTEAQKQWTTIERAYAEPSPAEYARDPEFKARLRDIANALEDMQRALASGDPRRSMLPCGFACGQFAHARAKRREPRARQTPSTVDESPNPRGVLQCPGLCRCVAASGVTAAKERRRVGGAAALSAGAFPGGGLRRRPAGAAARHGSPRDGHGRGKMWIQDERTSAGSALT